MSSVKLRLLQGMGVLRVNYREGYDLGSTA